VSSSFARRRCTHDCGNHRKLRPGTRACASTAGASEIGQCARKVFFAKNAGDESLGISPDEGHAEAWGATLRGQLFEEHCWVPALRARFGGNLLYAGSEQITLTADFLSATPDGLITGLPRGALAHLGVDDIGGHELVVECKTIDPRTRLDAPKPEHRFQAAVQTGLLRELTSHKPAFALLSYVNASFLDDIVEFPIAFAPEIFAAAKARAAQIMSAETADELLPEGWIAGGAECGHCPFTKVCGRQRHAVPYEPVKEPPDPQLIAGIAALARKTREHRITAEAAQAALRRLEHELREQLRVAVTWSTVKGRPAYDMPAIRAAAAQAGIDLSQFETAGDPTDRLTISRIHGGLSMSRRKENHE
jgi:hypothetical protein